MLSDAKIRALQPREKPYRVTDGNGLTLRVAPTGVLSWQMHFTWESRRQILSFGLYPDVPLKRAREKLMAARVMLADGKDPRETLCRSWKRATLRESLQTVFDEWLKLQSKRMAAATLSKTRWLAKPILAKLGSWPMTSIKAPDLLTALRRWEEAGHNESAHRARQIMGQVFRYAISTGRAQHNIVADLRDALAPVVTTNHAGLTDPAQVGGLLLAIDGYQGQPSVQAALRLAPLVFLRSWELRGADWQEFQLEGAEPYWLVPPERMKKDRPHVVPLARQAVTILAELHALTGPSGLVFPGLRTRERPISNNTLNAALRRLGYANDEHVLHGFRTTASTLLRERDFPPEVVEMQLSHVQQDETAGAYNKAKYLPKRREMMQAWADYLDSLKTRATNRPAAPGHAESARGQAA
jgi:integrase